jgi:RNA polymerase-associated protein RTF1
MGGKRPPQQPQSKKRKAGKKKTDSSDSSSDDDDSSSSSSSSSDDEQEEVAAKMPVKKRGKLTPATPKPDSGDESSDFEPEFDKDFFKGEEDRRWLMGLSEVDREQIITERQEKQAVKREAWDLQHRQKKAAARAGASSAKGREVKDKEPATPGPAAAAATASVARGRATRGEGSSVARDKNADKRAALEDMEARKVEQQQKRQGTRADIMEEDDDDAPRKRQEEGKKMKPPHRQIPQEEKYPKLEKKELEAARVTRDRLIGIKKKTQKVSALVPLLYEVAIQSTPYTRPVTVSKETY